MGESKEGQPDQHRREIDDLRKLFEGKMAQIGQNPEKLAFLLFRKSGYGEKGTGFGSVIDKAMVFLKEKMRIDTSDEGFQNEVTFREIVVQFLREYEDRYLASLEKESGKKE